MEENRIYKLLSRYVLKTIAPSEWSELKVLLEQASDEKLLELLEKIWAETKYPDYNMPSEEDLRDIYITVRKKTEPAPLKKILYYTLRTAGVFTIMCLTGLSLYLYKDRKYRIALGEKDVIVNVAKGQKVTVTLPDNSVVYLNAESTLSYKQNFGYKNRSLAFKGEAFFDIRKEKGKRFVINTEHLKATVLGTSFNFSAYENAETVELTLITGAVKIATNTASPKEIFVKPHEKAIYNKLSGALKLEKANVRLETAWMNGDLIFRSETIATVLSEVERKYGVKIQISGVPLKYDKFTGTFIDEDIHDVMEILKTHYKFKYKIEGANVWIYTEAK